jgi:hypothetical protein
LAGITITMNQFNKKNWQQELTVRVLLFVFNPLSFSSSFIIFNL